MNNNGATIWARKTIDSEIFKNKPDKWFKIFFYIVSYVNYSDTSTFKRGEGFFQTSWITEATKATPDQVKKCLATLRQMKIISTRRSTRGMLIKVLTYNKYQNMNTYTSTEFGTRAAPEKHQRSTTITEEKKKRRKEEVIPIAETSSAQEVIPNLLLNPQKHIQIIGLYAIAKQIQFKSVELQRSFIKRNVRSAQSLVPYDHERIKQVMVYLLKKADFKWTLETVGKFIDEDLNNLKFNKSKFTTI